MLRHVTIPGTWPLGKVGTQNDTEMVSHLQTYACALSSARCQLSVCKYKMEISVQIY